MKKFTPSRVRCAIFCLAAMSWVADSASAQVANAALVGQVVDPTGAAVVGAALKMIETDRGTSYSATTDAEGRYTFPNLRVGPYRLEASMAGFKTFVQNGIVLLVGDSPEITVRLEVGLITENIEVSASAAIVQTEKTSVSQVIDQQSIVELPLNGRQPMQLVLVSGAAVVTPPGDNATTKNYFSSATISVAGGQSNGTNYMLDGGDNMDRMTNVNLPFPFPDALQEFSVDTNALPARNGTQPGGLVNIVTKSGTNAYHGDLFEFVRNGVLNARNTFSIAADTLKRNQFGGTIGGKVIKDKLFFFGGYQGTRIVSVPPSSIAFVPTPLELKGDFSVQASPTCQSSGISKTLKNPVTGQAFAGNQIPLSMLDPAALKLATYLPVTGNACGQATFALPTVQNEDQFIGRVDWIQNSRHSVFGRYFKAVYDQPSFYSRTNILLAGNPHLGQGVQAFTLGDTYTFGPAVLNSFHATVTRRTVLRGPAQDQPNVLAFGVNVFNYQPNDQRVVVTNDFATGCNFCSPGHFNANTFQFADDVDLIRGKHHLSFGADIIRTQVNINAAFSSDGVFTFNGSVTGDAMADFLIGSLSAFSQSKPQFVSTRQTIPALYAQDVIKINPRLTINAGLRWEPTLFPYDYFHRGAVFSMANFLAGVHSTVFPNAPAGASYYGESGVLPGFSSNTWTNFSPRLGFAWDPHGDGRGTLRVGAAIMYDSAELYATQRAQSDPPYVSQIDLTTSNPGGFSNPWTTGYNYPGGNPFPPSANSFPLNPLWIVVPPKLKPTSVAQWNVTYQRQFGSSWLASVAYMGNKTSHLWTGLELNPAIYSPSVCAQFSTGCTTANTNQRKYLAQLNPSQGQYYGNVDQIISAGNANYNALFTSLNHRLSNGVTVLANYTWSHCISEVDFGGDVTGPGFMNPADLRRERSSCNFDIRQVFNLALVASSPIKGKGWIAHLLGDWQVSPLFRVLTGAPLNVTTGSDNSRTGVNLDRPNLNAGVGPYSSGSGPLQYLNPAAFTANAIGTFGNLGRLALRGPGQVSVDVGLSRIFPIREAIRLEVRGEAFNVINRVNYVSSGTTNAGIAGIANSGINLNLSSATFGRITSAGDPRILQIAMKLYF